MKEDQESWRSLTENEVSLLEALTSLDYPGAPELRDQIQYAEGRPGCQCGCGTIELRVARASAQPAPVTRSRPVVGEAEVTTADPPGGLILFAKDGYLDALEVFSFGDPLPLPGVGEIRTFVRDA